MFDELQIIKVEQQIVRGAIKAKERLCLPIKENKRTNQELIGTFRAIEDESERVRRVTVLVVHAVA